MGATAIVDTTTQVPEVNDQLLPHEAALARIVTDAEVLSKPCLPVTDDNRAEAEDIATLLISVAETIHGHNKLNCLGLAANQLGHNLRVFVIRDKKGRYRAFFNPELSLKRKKYKTKESCYSFPGKEALVERFKEVVLTDTSGKRHQLRGSMAQAAQHELDHLDGVCI